MRFGPGAGAELTKAVPSGPPVRISGELPVTVDLEDLAERTVAAVSIRRSTWTVLEPPRGSRAPPAHRSTGASTRTPPRAGRQGDRARRFTRLLDLGRSPAMLNETAELCRADGEPVFTEHAAGRFTCQAVLDAEARVANATRPPTATGLSGVSVAAALEGFEARSGTTLDA